MLHRMICSAVVTGRAGGVLSRCRYSEPRGSRPQASTSVPVVVGVPFALAAGPN